MRTHTGEKPFKCTHECCTYASARAEILAIHMRTHTGEKPYKCTHEGCTYAATTSGNLATHMRTHTGDKPYKCTHEGCTYAAARAAHLKSHIKNHHPEEPMTPAGIAAANELLQLAVQQTSQAAASSVAEEDASLTSFLSDDESMQSSNDQDSQAAAVSPEDNAQAHRQLIQPHKFQASRECRSNIRHMNRRTSAKYVMRSLKATKTFWSIILSIKVNVKGTI